MNKPFDAVEWMAENGHLSYKNRIEELKKQLRAYADEDNAQILEEIDEIRREAYDRYDDWRSDPLD